ncbi:MAG: hypothetical protein ACK44C_12240 [Polaromonas sp.]
MSPSQSLRLVVIAPDLAEPDDDHERSAALVERSRQLRIGLLKNGHNIIAVLPADTFFEERRAQLQPDMIIIDAEKTRLTSWPNELALDNQVGPDVAAWRKPGDARRR